MAEATRRIAEHFNNSEERMFVQIVQASSMVKRLFENVDWPAIGRSAGDGLCCEAFMTPFPEHDSIRLNDSKGMGSSKFVDRLDKWRVLVPTHAPQSQGVAYIQFLSRRVSVPDETETEYVAMAGMRFEPQCSLDAFASNANVSAESVLGLGLAAFRSRYPSTDSFRLECVDLYYDDFAAEWRMPLEPGIVVDILASRVGEGGRLSYFIGRFHIPVLVGKPSSEGKYDLEPVQYVGGGTKPNVIRPYVKDGIVFGRPILRWDAQQRKASPISIQNPPPQGHRITVFDSRDQTRDGE